MTKTFTIKQGQKPTDEQLQEVMEAKKHPIVFDEDSRIRRNSPLPCIKMYGCLFHANA